MGECDYQIVDSTPGHIRDLSQNMRDNDRMEVCSIGFTEREIVRKSYDRAIWKKTVFVNGKLACMFGLGGHLLSDTGVPWLLTTREIERIPLAFVREAKREVRKMLGHFRRLENYVHADYAAAIRFLEILGFTVHPEVVEVGPNRAKFRKFTMERT